MIYLFIGAVCRKLNILSQKSQGDFINFLLKIALPCMVFSSFKLEMNIENMRIASLALVISLTVCVVSFFLGKILYRKYDFSIRSIMQYNTLISNAGFAGLPIVTSAYGTTALFFASFFLIPFRVFIWTAGVALFKKGGVKTGIKGVLLTPGTIAVMLGLVRMITRIPVPEILDSSIDHISDCSLPLSMIVIGAILSEVPIKTVLNKAVLYLSFVRLLALPLITLVVLRLLNAPELITSSSVLLVGMPAGTMSVMFAQDSDTDAAFASKCVFVSTILSLITIPLLSLLL